MGGHVGGLMDIFNWEVVYSYLFPLSNISIAPSKIES